MTHLERAQIIDNVAEVQQIIAAACAKAERDPAEVTLVAVSKKKPQEDILAAVAAGLQHFGENRVEESQIKIPELTEKLDAPVIWHMVGHIQSRKARYIPPLFDVVHSLDSLKLAEKLSRLLADSDETVDVLLQMNVAGEEQKYGFEASHWDDDAAVREQVWAEVKQVLALPGLTVRGLMTMAPIVDDMEQTRPVFSSLAALRDALAADFEVALPDLSMGMTDDYPVAIEEGATIIRVGRAIFGERAY